VKHTCYLKLYKIINEIVNRNPYCCELFMLLFIAKVYAYFNKLIFLTVNILNGMPLNKVTLCKWSPLLNSLTWEVNYNNSLLSNVHFSKEITTQWPIINSSLWNFNKHVYSSLKLTLHWPLINQSEPTTQKGHGGLTKSKHSKKF